MAITLQFSKIFSVKIKFLGLAARKKVKPKPENEKPLGWDHFNTKLDHFPPLYF